MLSRGIAFALLWLATSVATYASGGVLQGYVITNDLTEPTLGDAFVDAPGAIRTKTNDDGSFTLEFPDQLPGDRVRLTVEKGGYEVVNDVQLETLLPEDGESVPIFVLVCRAGQREEAANALYKVSTEIAIEAQWNQRSVAIAASDTAAMEKLRCEYLQAVSASRSSGWRLAAIQPGETSALYRKAMRLFLEGNTYAAILHLDDGALRAAVAEARANEESNPEALDETAVNPWLLKAHLYTIQLEFAEVEATYQTAAAAIPESFEVSYYLALFQRDLNRPVKAIETFQRCVALAKKWGLQEDLGATFQELAALYEGERDVAAASTAYGGAIQAYRELAGTQPKASLPKLAVALYNFGRLNEDENRLSAAESEYAECLAIRRALARSEPATYLPCIAHTLSDLADVFGKQKRMQEARDATAEAVKIYRELVRTEPETNIPLLAAALYRLGTQNSDENRLDTAHSCFAEALENYRELARADAVSYLPDVAHTLNHLVQVLREEGREEELRAVFDEAVKTYRELARTDPEVHLPNLANSLYNLGRVNEDEKRPVAAESDYVESLRIRRELARSHPEAHLPGVAQTLGDLADVLNKQERAEEAGDALDEAVQIYRELEKAQPKMFRPRLALTLAYLGVLQGNQRQFEVACAAIEEALPILRDLAEDDPDYYAEFVSRLADYLERLKR